MRMFLNVSQLLAVVAVASVMCLPVQVLGATRYRITDLGPGYASAINNKGQVVGVLNSPQPYTPFLYDNGVTTFLGTLGGAYTRQLADINNYSQIVGVSNTANGAEHAFLYSGGVMTDLGTLGGTNSQAAGINDLGQIVGISDSDDPYATGPVPFLYNQGFMASLSTSSWGRTGKINSTGQVAGYDLPAGSSYQQAVIFSNGTTTYLGNLPGMTVSEAGGINDLGDVVGYSGDTAVNVKHAFLYKSGTMTDINPFGSSSSVAASINISGQIVGSYYHAASNTNHAFLYDNGIVTDLSTLIGGGWLLWTAQDINDSGQIVGWGYKGGVQHAFLLSPR